MKDRVLWIGSPRRCRSLIRIYSDKFSSLYTKKVSKGFLEKHAEEFLAAVIAPYRSLPPNAHFCTELLDFSEKNKFPVIIVGSKWQFYGGTVIRPYAALYRADDNDLLKAFRSIREKAPSDPVSAVIIFSSSFPLYAFCEEIAEEIGPEYPRTICCQPDAKVLKRLTDRKVSACLLICCDDSLSALGRIKKVFPKAPVAVLYRSDEPPIVEGLQPLAFIDVKNGTDELKRLLEEIRKPRKELLFGEV